MKLASLMRGIFISVLITFYPATALAQGSSGTARGAGISGIWVLANISYAGMRAQGNDNFGWRVISFIFGFPGTFISLLAIWRSWKVRNGLMASTFRGRSNMPS